MMSAAALTAEQARYLAEGNRHRARYYGAELADADLTLALAWWTAYWRERADQADVRKLAPSQGELYEAA